MRHGEGPRSACPLTHVAEYLSSRIRLTDELGWLDKDQLCVVLSATSSGGAWKMAETIQKDRDQAALLEYTVYFYPSHETLSLDTDPTVQASEHRDDALTAPMESLFAQPTRGWKRCLDVAGAVVAIILLSPILLVTAISVRLTSRGPILFSQWRSGRGGMPFRMYKFRSMCVDAEKKKRELLEQNEQDGPAFKIRDDPRVTWVGRILRRTSVDEFPQLWNVLKGDMSLVGPRPLPCDETANCRTWHRRRVDVAPGMTCIWQLHGRSKVSFDDWVRMDISYIRKLSLLQDMKLLVGTLPVLLWRASGY